MAEPNIASMVAVGATYLGSTFQAELDTTKAEEFLREILHGERNIWGAYEARIMTRDEFVGATADWFLMWVLHSVGADIRCAEHADAFWHGMEEAFSNIR